MLPTRKKPQDYEFTFEQQRRAKRIAQFMGWGVVACIAVLVIYNIGLAAGRAIR